MKLYFHHARILTKCPACSEPVTLGPPRHQIVAGAQGIEVKPDISCRCGVILRVRRSRVQVLGRIELPAKTKSVQADAPPREQPAITIEVKRPKRPRRLRAPAQRVQA